MGTLGGGSPRRRGESPVSAPEALERLRTGNQRFVARAPREEMLQQQRAELVEGQQPFAVVLGCSDSRVPAELVFDQGLGDLFVIRVAGNIVAPSQIGSVEFAVERFGTALVVVLGHSLCGAVTATIDALTTEQPPSSRNLNSIVERIRPAVQACVAVGGSQIARETLLQEAVRANVRVSAGQLRHGSQLIESRVQAGTLFIVGAEYDLRTGVVDFFDGASDLETDAQH